MTIDPVVWRQIVGDVALPNVGDRITYSQRHARERIREGIVSLIFLAEDEPAIKIDGAVTIFPTLGDWWAPISPPKAAA
jgi:hypothetical protein